jgi:hypothetical protein
MKTKKTKHDANTKKISTASRTERTRPYTNMAKKTATTPMTRANFIWAIIRRLVTVTNRDSVANATLCLPDALACLNYAFPMKAFRA